MKQKTIMSWVSVSPGCQMLYRSDLSDSLERASQVWVFGLRWLPTVGARSQKLLLRQLSKERVQWWNRPGGQSTTIGFLPPSCTRLRPSAQMVCVASQFALSHPKGTHFLRWVIAPEKIWVVAVHEGNVLSQTDCWLNTEDQVVQLETVLRERYPELESQTVYGSDEELTQDDAFEELLKAVGVKLQNPATPVIPIHQTARLKRLKTTYVVGHWIVVVLMLVLLWVGWFVLRQPSAQSPIGLSAPESESTRQTQTSHARSQPTPPEAINTLFEALSSLPVQGFGWQLETIQCELQALAAQCRAAYVRTNANTTNQQLQRALNPHWSLQSVSLDRTDVLLQVTLSGTHVSQKYPSTAYSDWFAELQRLSRYFETVELSAQRLEAAVTMPPNVDQVQEPSAYRQLQLSMWLKHFPKLQDSALQVRWRKLRLEILSAGVLTMSAQTNESSQIRLFLEGDLIER